MKQWQNKSKVLQTGLVPREFRTTACRKHECPRQWHSMQTLCAECSIAVRNKTRCNDEASIKKCDAKIEQEWVCPPASNSNKRCCSMQALSGKLLQRRDRGP